MVSQRRILFYTLFLAYAATGIISILPGPALTCLLIVMPFAITLSRRFSAPLSPLQFDGDTHTMEQEASSRVS